MLLRKELRSLKTKYKFDGNAVAGKTGTTNNFTDAWFMGLPLN